MVKNQEIIEEFIQYLESGESFCIVDSTDLSAPYTYSEKLLSYLESVKSEPFIAKVCEEEKVRVGTLSSMINSGALVLELKKILAKGNKVQEP